MPKPNDRGPYISKKKVAARYDTTTRTIDRWATDPDYRKLGFPERLIINSHVFFSEPELIEFERRRAAATMAPKLRGIARQHRERGSETDPTS